MIKIAKSSSNLNLLRTSTSPFFSNLWVQDNFPQLPPQNVPARRLSTGNISNNQSTQGNLQRLPVPPLKDTLTRYLKTAQPFLSTEEYKKTEKLCSEFENGIGQKLQELLINRAKNKEDWMAEWWVKYAYLAYRDPVVVHSNPGLAFPKSDKIKTLSDQIDYAAKITHLALKYKKTIDDKKIPQEKMGSALLDMSQYEKIFGTCRIPGKEIDSIEYHPTSKHIIVFYKNNIFKVPVYGGINNDVLISENEIKEQIKSCIDQTKDNAPPIGILTTDQRDNWGKAYEILIKDPKNFTTVREIHTSLFVLAIDDSMVKQGSNNDLIIASHQLITGGGSSSNSGNRWYDKTVQFIVGNTGINGITYEHTPAEGQPIAVMTDKILGELKNTDSSSTVGYVKSPEKLQFNVSNELNNCLELARKNIDKLSENLDMEVLHFKNYGKNFIKLQKMSPDSFIQMAIQYAFYRLHKTPGAHYESAHTRLYIHGRTETIRSCSTESIAFAKSMTELHDDKERVNLLRAAVNAHKNYTVLALQGLGVDRHFFALKLIANENKIPLPEIFNDPGYTRSAHMRLSTSQVASKYEAFMCYGPLVENGYGCCYNPRDNDMYFACSAMKSSTETSASKFAKCLEECFLEMKSLLERTTEIKSKL